MKKDFIPVIIAYALALALGTFLFLKLPWSVLMNALVADLAATVLIFVFARAYKNSSFYDAYWSVMPIAIAFWWSHLYLSDVEMTRSLIVFGLIVLWGLRLTWNWASHWPGLHHEDFRYQPIRDKAGKFELFADFFSTHLFPTLIVLACLLPVHAVMNLSHAPLNWLDYLAIVVTLGAILIETIADIQLHRFNAVKKKGEYINTGLWKLSRHPNYFGEYGFWFGLMLFGLAAWPQGWMWIVPGVVAMGLMFAFASIPMMEERSLASRDGYADYMKKTSAFIPLPPKK